VAAAGGVCPDALALVVTSAVPAVVNASARTAAVLIGVHLMFMVSLF
jgi:hypothetical protein